MEQSILTSTKKILGVAEDYEAFDLDIITHINSAFSQLNQLGIGLEESYSIEDKASEWDDLALPVNQLGYVKTYIYLKTKLLFDPPNTSFLIDAMNKVITEQEYRLINANELPSLNI